MGTCSTLIEGGAREKGEAGQLRQGVVAGRAARAGRLWRGGNLVGVMARQRVRTKARVRRVVQGIFSRRVVLRLKAPGSQRLVVGMRRRERPRWSTGDRGVSAAVLCLAGRRWS